jgi:uncharacterized membrane protein YhaH (DUF805 family)
VTFTESIRTCLHNYGTFDGRASRSEFWWFYLFIGLVGIAGYVPFLAFTIIAASVSSRSAIAAVFGILAVIWMIVWIVAMVALVIPQLAVGCRRLHDRGQSGWLLLLQLVPCGSIALIVLWVLEGTPGSNAYGPPATS